MYTPCKIADIQVKLHSDDGIAFARLLVGYPGQLEGDLNDLPYGLIQERNRPICYLASLHAVPSHHGLGTHLLSKLPLILKKFPDIREVYTLAWATHHSAENPEKFYHSRGFKFVAEDVTDHPYLCAPLASLAQFAMDTPCHLSIHRTDRSWSPGLKLALAAICLVGTPLLLRLFLRRRHGVKRV